MTNKRKTQPAAFEMYGMPRQALAHVLPNMSMPPEAAAIYNAVREPSGPANDDRVDPKDCSDDDLQRDLRTVETTMDRIRADAAKENRELNQREQSRIEQYQEVAATLEAELSARHPPQRRTEPDPIRNTASNQQRGAQPVIGLTAQGGLLPQNAADPLRYIFGNRHSTESRFQGTTAEFLAQCRSPALAMQNATATEGIGIDGGFAVPATLHQQVMAELMETSEFWKLCRLYPATANNVSIALPDVMNQLQNLAGYQVDWKAEASSLTSQILKWRAVNLELGKLTAMAEASSELEEDAPNYARMVELTLGADAGMRLDHALIAGNGNGGTPLGYLNADSVIEVNPESGQAADSIVWQNIVQLYSRVHAACKRRAVWVVTSEAMSQLLNMTLPNGNPALLSGGTNDGGAGALAPRMLGRPIIESTLAPMLGDRGDIALVDFSQVALIMKNASRIDFSPHLNFDRDVLNWRLRWRVSATPIWNKVFSPRNGGLSLSWAAVLGARD